MPQRGQRVGAGGRVYSGGEAADRADAVASAGARTTSGVSSVFNTEDMIALLAVLVITAVAGTTPTLDLKLQELASPTDDATNWNDVAPFPQKNATGTHAKTFGPFSAGGQLRWNWTLGGTGPSFTFRIDHMARRSLG
jgi:hypothetical protein